MSNEIQPDSTVNSKEANVGKVLQPRPELASRGDIPLRNIPTYILRKGLALTKYLAC